MYGNVSEYDMLCHLCRHLYLECLKHCYLFHSCKPKFLDAVISACRADMFMPDVQLISEGDIVSELHIIIEGEVEICAFGGHGGDSSKTGDASHQSIYGSTKEGSKAGSFFGNRRDSSKSGSFFGGSRKDSASSGSFFRGRDGSKLNKSFNKSFSRGGAGNSQRSFK